MFPTKEMPSEVNSSYSILLVSLGMCLYEMKEIIRKSLKTWIWKKHFHLICSS